MIKEILRQILSDRKEWLRYLKYKKALPKNPMHDDIYIVEFPKSGITWLQHLIGNIELQLANKNESITFYNHHKYMPDIHQVGSSFLKRYGERTFIKSHAEYNPYYYFVIYLMRNPFDVMVSYYNFMLRFGYNQTFEKFVKDPNYGISKWKKHINSWNYNQLSAQRIHFIKYEDLLQDTENLLKDLYLNIGVNLDDNILKNSIHKSSLNQMKNFEEHYKKHNINYNFSFVGKEGKIKKNELLTDGIKDYIKNICREELQKFFPEYL